jgi:hypothetical protein
MDLTDLIKINIDSIGPHYRTFFSDLSDLSDPVLIYTSDRKKWSLPLFTVPFDQSTNSVGSTFYNTDVS